MSNPKNIAIIAGQLVIGGAERQLFLWLSNLDRKKFRPVVVTLHPDCGDYWENKIEALGIPLLRVPHQFSRIARMYNIARILKPFEPHLIHGWHLFASPYAGLVAKKLNAKSLGSLRSSITSFQRTPLESNLTLLFVDAIVANSALGARHLSKAKKRRNQKVFAVQNAVEDPLEGQKIIRKKVSRRFKISNDLVWIGSLGRLEPGKSFDLLLKAIAQLVKEARKIHLIMIGDGSEKKHLEKLANDLDITNSVTFTGELPDAKNWLSALDIFCFTSKDEGLPNVILEAAVASVPIISWRVPFNEEILCDRDTAILVEPGNIKDLMNSLVELIKSPELREKIGKAGRNHVIKNYSVKQSVQRMTTVYEEILGN
jgi:glycosyltransferase involved in cell wall biosynthesis